ncbi:MAG: hypothetical protein MJ065_04340 [Oscillospiraceae bacterium]|nr:hypothetical protein [Oscillospiraceae bacterium]
MARRKKGVSCLGVLLILCMIVLIVCTGTVRLLFRNGNAPKLFGKRFVYYAEDDMGSRVPDGVLVFAEDTDQIDTQDIVLYKNAQDQYRIAVASLIVETDSSIEGQSGKTFYLTTVTNTTAFETDSSKVIGICRRLSRELGAVIKVMIGTPGLILLLIMPAAILVFYLLSLLLRRGDDASVSGSEEADNDLEFVKSIQQKQQQIAERDAERAERERRKTQTFDDGFYEDQAEKTTHRLSDEEIAKMEEEEAARRAERIAAVRSHMEQRRQTETPDGVPLYTTEIITKTHTLSIPRVGDQLTRTQQRPLRPTPTEDIPRLTATGHLQIPTAEQIAAEKQAEERMRRAQALARAAQAEAFAPAGTVGTRFETHSADEEPEQEPAAQPERRPYRSVHGMTAEEIAELYRRDKPAASPEPAAADSEPAASVSAAQPESAAEEAFSAPVKKTVKKVVKKSQIASASFDDLMAFLDNEQKKL